MKKLAVPTTILGGALLSGRASAITIIPTFADGAGQVWDATKQAVINQAISDWEASVLDNQTINVTFDFMNAGTGGYLGLWHGSENLFVGTNVYPWTPGVTQVVHFNVDLMDATQQNYLLFTTGALPFDNWDALSVARHELGHMLGFTTNFYVNDFHDISQLDRWAAHEVGSVFDPGGLNVQMAADLSHTADTGSTANDLMNPASPNGIRRPISPIDEAMLAEAHHYQLAPDPNGDGTINFSDVLTLIQHYGQSNANFTVGDFNGDGTVNFSDVLVLIQHYGQSLATTSDPAAPALSPEVAQAPEPATPAILGLAVCLLSRRRKRHEFVVAGWPLSTQHRLLSAHG